MNSPGLPRKLQRDDLVEEFECGADELDQWLKKFAYANLRANNAITYVSLLGGRVVGYYAIAVAAVEREQAPIPCILLARLATDLSVRGQGIGRGLLRDALERAAHLSDSVGAAAVLVHARDDTAKAFYEANGDFLQSPVEPLHLMAPMKDLRKIFLAS